MGLSIQNRSVLYKTTEPVLVTDKPFNRLKASIAPLIGHHPCAKIFVILTTA